MVKQPCFGKNVSLKLETVRIIQGFMNKTKKNFSQTVNIMIEQWDEFSIVIQEWKRQENVKENLKYLEEQKNAKVITK